MKYPMLRVCPVFKVGMLLLGLASATSSLVAAITINLTPSRTTGVAPLAVYFDASTTTADSSITFPMHTLSFDWDFGDPGSGTWAISGQSKNFATGPAAAHVFKNPGTYQVTVAVTDGATQSSSKTVTITVTDPNNVFAGTNTICFSPDNDFTGAPAGALQVKTSNLATVLGHAAPNRRLLLKRGASFTSAMNTVQVGGPGILGSFGPASAPPRLVGSTATFLYWKSTDWRILDLEFQGNGAAGTATMQLHAPTSDTLIMNTRVVPNTVHGVLSSALTFPEKTFVVENEWRDTGFGGFGGCIIFMLAKRLALLGNVLDDGSGAEHIVRLPQIEKGVISHNYFAKPKAEKTLLTIRSQDGDDSFEVFVSDNIFVSHGDEHVGLIQKNVSTHTVKGQDFIFERNFFKKDPTTSETFVSAIGVDDAKNVTIRNNVILFNGWGHRAVEVARTDNVWFYNNSAYSTDSSTLPACFIDFNSGTNHVARNNLWYAPGLTNVNPLIENATVSSNNLKATTNPYAFSTITAPEHFVLSATSAARNAGTAVPVLDDYDLNPRPNGTAWDIGAYEYSVVSNLLSHGTFGPNQATVLQDMTNPYVLGTGAANIWQGRVGAPGSQTTTYQTDGTGNQYLTVGPSTNGPGAFQVIAWPGAGTKQLTYSYRGTASKVKIYRGTTGNWINKFDGTNSLSPIQEFTNPSAATWTTATQNVTLSGTYNYLVIQIRAGDFDNVVLAP
jgi:hypothetical protein